MKKSGKLSQPIDPAPILGIILDDWKEPLTSSARRIVHTFKLSPTTVRQSVAETTNPVALDIALVGAAISPRLDILDDLLARADVHPTAHRSSALYQAVLREGNEAILAKLYPVSNVSDVVNDLSDLRSDLWPQIDRLFCIGLGLGLPEVPKGWVETLPHFFPQSCYKINEKEALKRAGNAPTLDLDVNNDLARRRARP